METTTSKLLSSRLRAGVECAPWVIEEVKRLERHLTTAGSDHAVVAFVRDFLVDYEEHEESEWSLQLRELAERARAINAIAGQMPESAPMAVAGSVIHSGVVNGEMATWCQLSAHLPAEYAGKVVRITMEPAAGDQCSACAATGEGNGR